MTAVDVPSRQAEVVADADVAEEVAEALKSSGAFSGASEQSERANMTAPVIHGAAEGGRP
ncbi:MAG: hypothetical protein JO148_04570 [Acidimicrobiia bacterium]|nr:hypothetical protein [Acidimicrobiia bacterium]